MEQTTLPPKDKKTALAEYYKAERSDPLEGTDPSRFTTVE